ncbi:MAG: hypothetical protein JW878_06735 [Methanomicrobia archaeon]|nr:hypothetical protein [Methanomicrobia archaeon]
MKTKRIRIGLVLVTALSLLVIATTVPVGAQPVPSATVSIDSITLAPQTSATIPIMITEAPENASAALINLTYDPTVVQIMAVVNVSGFDYFNYTLVDGKVRMIGTQNGAANLQPPITFAEVTVKAIGNPGECTPLNLEGYVVQGHGTIYPEHEFINGSVCIVQGVPAYNTFGMIALIGLLAMVLAVAVKRR